MENTLNDVFDIIGGNINLSEEEFLTLPSNEKNDWIESCKLACILYENKLNELYDRYKSSNIFNSNGEVDLSLLTLFVKSKKSLYDAISNDPNRPGTLVEFILLGEVGVQKIVNQAIHNEYMETAKEINDAKLNYY